MAENTTSFSQGPLPISEVDFLLTAQLGVAWAGEGGEEPRLGWWRSDLVSEFGGEDLLRRLLPNTWRWATLQGARAAAMRRDREIRTHDHDPDRLLTLFSLGFDVDERVEERLGVGGTERLGNRRPLEGVASDAFPPTGGFDRFRLALSGLAGVGRCDLRRTGFSCMRRKCDVTLPLFQQTQLQEAFVALRRDLIHEDGPRISTMRNYRFAIVQYAPSDEFRLRGEVQKLLLDRARAQGDEWMKRVIEMERRMSQSGFERGLNYLKSKLAPLIEGPTGIAADCGKIVRDLARAHPDQVDRTLALIGRAGALYPFSRSSTLLRHLDGNTDNVPVVLLYPGERIGLTGLSFMGVLDSDNDYRPRIYP
jgi:hypothetical protein